MKFILFLILFIPALVSAQETTAQPVNSAPTVTITVSPQEYQVLVNLIAEKPYKDVAGFLEKLQRQVVPQLIKQGLVKVPETQAADKPKKE